MIYGFSLGREFKLSIAEILAIFPTANVVFSAKSVLLLSDINKDDILKKADSLGGTIKIFELELVQDQEDILDSILGLTKGCEGKFKYSLNLFGESNINLEIILKKSKRFLKEKSISSRYFNKDDGKNLSSATILGNSILKKGFDLNIVDMGGLFYFGKTLWVQDIDAYSARDYGKSRDMDVGMLPPKLSQMMINLSRDNENGGNIKGLYDPFCGLGTILIEGAYMGIDALYGSDFSEKMVHATKGNLGNLKGKGMIFTSNIELFDARDMGESNILRDNKIDSIVTEGFLGEVMTQKNISLDRIAIQRTNLSKLYEKFFLGLSDIGFKGTIVMSLPFWDLKGKYLYLSEVYAIINHFCEILPIFPKEFNFSETKSGSLLYRREKQLVGREVFKLSIK